MSQFNTIVEAPDYTIVGAYTPTEKKAEHYQTEAQLEAEFIRMLGEQGYEYATIHTEEELIKNLRSQLEKLNSYTFTESEWERFFNNNIANKNDGIIEKTTKIQEDYIQVLKRDSGESKNIYLIDKANIHNNNCQVINQFEQNDGAYENRYDVTILINGLPLVHVELKRRGVMLKEAFNQIDRYQRESFWAGSGLYEYIQIFVISNGTNTKYYSNTTRKRSIAQAKGQRSHKNSSNSFEFTSFWADITNKPIPDLIDFTKTFFAKRTLLEILTKYCVFTKDRDLMVMRPYQIAATERIIQRINVANNYKLYGTIQAGGYIWHTTGSGKTLTSFKTAQLASRLDFIDKVLFVVDRKDLDDQTMKEYNRFEEGAADGNKSTAVLARQLSNKDASGAYHQYKIIVTTIQKLSIFVNKNKGHEIYQKPVVIIFDECHRSNFGDMHRDIVRSFKKYFLFGFTGTPILAENATPVSTMNIQSGKTPTIQATTAQVFGDKLHTYTIVNAINDQNVLPFRIDYINTFKAKDGIADKKVKAIDEEKALAAPERIANVVKYILEHYDSKTKRNNSYTKGDKHLKGFNAMLATASIPFAKAYYQEFKKQQAELAPAQRLKVALIYSYSANEEALDGGILEEENPESTTSLDQQSRDFLQGAIQDYNEYFKTNFDTSSDRFQNYYRDLSKRMKDKEVDLLIVVNMFLTGFDATTLNTLFVDKNLKQHGLIQAFSRTNRILNSVKTFGNVVCFRDLQKATDEAIALFGDSEANSLVLLKDYNSYYYGYEDKNGEHVQGYIELVSALDSKFPIENQIIGNDNKKDFVRLFNALLKMRNILSSFDQFNGQEILTERRFQNYQGRYLDIKEEMRNRSKAEKEYINDDIVFEMELVRQIDITIDYILELVRQYHKANCQDKEIFVKRVDDAIMASDQLRSKRELILAFINSVNVDTNIDEDWISYTKQKRDEDLNEIIKSEGLKSDETYRFIESCFREGEIRTTGTDIDKILPPISRFGATSQTRQNKKKSVIEKLKAFFNKYFGIF